ncbi:MAG: hypothetical protein CME06_04570 [Gemmatimonadetes bacterium]|nr:hypothetical protein [Gemmatimonadota bacterium]
MSPILPILLFATLVLRQVAGEWALVGAVVGEEDGIPISGASISVEGEPFGAVSDGAGHFAITGLSDGVYRLTVRHVGYRTATRSAVRLRGGRAPRLSFSLKSRVHELGTTVVRAEREPIPGALPPPEAGSVVTTLHGSEIRAMGAEDLGEALAFAPGVQLERDAAGGTVSASIRGSGGERVLVLVDGLPINDPATGEADLREVPVHSIERVEVRRGAMAAAMGHGGVGGVIAVVTESPLVAPGGGSRPSALRLRVESGEYGWRSVRGSVRGTVAGVLTDVEAGDSRYSGDLPVAEPTYPYERIRNGDANEQSIRAGVAKLWSPGGLEVRASTWWRRAVGGAPGTLEFVTPEARVRHERGTAHLSLRRGSWANGRLHVGADLSASVATHRYRSPATQDGQPSFPADRRNDARIVRAESRLVWGDAGGGGRWSGAGWVGLDRHEDIDYLKPDRGTGARGRDEGGVDLGALFRRRPFGPGSLVSLQSGLRADRLFPGGWLFAPRFGMELEDASGDWILGAGASRTLRPPTLNDLFWSGDLNLSGNPNLRPEVALGMDGNAIRRFGNGWTLEARTWVSRVRDLIQWQAGPALEWRPVNVPAARLAGSEWSIQWRGGPGIRLEGGATFQRAENRDESDTNSFGKALVFRADRLVHLRAGWRRPDGDGIDLSYRFVGRQPTTAANTVYLDAYGLFDASGSYTLVRHGGWLLKAGIDARNLLDARYRSAVDALPPGRELRGDVSIEFDVGQSLQQEDENA